jgi:hypothetical protein
LAAKYHLITRLRLSVDRRRTWDTFIDVRKWPTWWRWLERVEVIDEGDDRGVGAVFRQSIRSPLRYGFTWQTEIVHIVEESLVEFNSTGALEGRGRFEMSGLDNGPTDVVFTWLVTTNKSWMNLMSPIGRPFFTWNHDRLMDDFGRGMASAAGGRLLTVTHQSVHPRAEGFFRMPEFDG